MQEKGVRAPHDFLSQLHVTHLQGELGGVPIE